MLRSIMQLIEGRTAAEWLYVSDASADVAFCRPSRIAPVPNPVMQRLDGGPIRVMVTLTETRSNPAEPEISFPFRPRQMISLLRVLVEERLNAPAERQVESAKVAGRPIRYVASTSETVASPDPDTAPQPTPSTAVPTTSQAIHELAMVIRQKPAGLVRLHGESFVAYMDVPSRIHLTSSSPEADASSLLSNGCAIERDAAPPQGVLRPAPLDRFLCALGAGLPEAQLLPWLDSSMSFQLSNWPDLGAMRDGMRFVGAATGLIRSRRTIGELVQDTGLRMADAIRLLNTCELLGHLTATRVESTERARTRADRSDTGRHRLLSAIRAALGIPVK